ncbi:hypothetical protein YC2023_114310 [Brassica napus]
MTSPLRNPSRSDSTPHAIELRNGSRYGTQASIPTTSSSMLLCFFFKLQQRRCRNFVVTSLLRFWEPRNVKKGGELLDVDLVVLMER